jgi:hypothetical protein
MESRVKRIHSEIGTCVESGWSNVSEQAQEGKRKLEAERVVRIRQAFETMIRDWNMMQSGTMEDQDANEDNAERFETNFHRLIEEIKLWYQALDIPPRTAEALQEIEPLQSLIEDLPAPLLLPFETELEHLVEGHERVADEKYD